MTKSIQNIIDQATPATQKEIKCILEGFNEWSTLFWKAIPTGNKVLGKKLVEISYQIANQVSTDTILLVAESTTEGTLNNTFLATLLRVKKTQAS